MDLSILTVTVGLLMTAVGMFWAFYAVAGVFLKPKKIRNDSEKDLQITILIPTTLVLKPKNPNGQNISLTVPATFAIEPNKPEPMKFSILIPARNEEDVIENILEDLHWQTYQNFEVFVICHNCTDDTFRKVFQYMTRTQDDRIFPLILNGEKGKAVALNYAAKKAAGDIIAVFDADNRVPYDTLEKAVKYFSKYDAIQSRIEASNADYSIISKLTDLEIATFSEMFQKSRYALGMNVGLGGTGEFIKREALEKVGYWDNSLAEDFALFAKLTRSKYKIAWASDVKVYDEKVPFAFAMLRQRARWLRGHFGVMLKNIRYFLKDPLNIHYLSSPIAITGYYLVYLFWFLTMLSLPFTTTFLPTWVWLPPSIIFFTGVAIQISRVRRKRDLLYLPLLFLYLYHWQIVFIGMFFVKNWGQAKTAHGFR